MAYCIHNLLPNNTLIELLSSLTQATNKSIIWFMGNKSCQCSIPLWA